MKIKAPLIPVSIIEEAVNGEPEALAYILGSYQGYIKALSTRKLFDKYGNECYVVDEEIQHRLEAKLIVSIVTGFNIQPD